MDKSQYARLLALQALAKKEFFYYCHVKEPDFYALNRAFLHDMCDLMQDFMTAEEEIMIINVPPRHGKSRTAQLLTSWLFGQDRHLKVMTASYNESLSQSFAANVRNIIQEQKGDYKKTVFNDIFPDVRIRRGDAAKSAWSLEGGYANYLATSPNGTATGRGCDLLIIDDILKSAGEAYNSRILQERWEWFTNTMLSRLEGKRKILIIMTRWATQDLAGKILKWCEETGKSYKHVNLQAVKPDGSMLCEEILSHKDFETLKSVMSEDILQANYQQQPVDIKGRLYTTLSTYSTLPAPLNTLKIQAYTDTADTGSDFLCSIIYAVHEKNAYILDVYYTKEPMEVTEKEVSTRHKAYQVSGSYIESNNGGRGFGRNVERLTREQGYHGCVFNLFHQSQNKQARIITQSTNVMNNIHFPDNWDIKWPEFFKDIIEYQTTGKNMHDDGPDVLTGICEGLTRRPGIEF